MFSTGRFRPGLFGLVAVLFASFARAQTPVASSDATLFRVFLRDGSTLVSYGEFARVADRVVLTMPLGGPGSAPTLELVSIPSSGVDWEKTDAYAESARAAKYAATRGPDEYSMLTLGVSNALAEITRTPDPDRKIAMAVEARQNVTKWVAEHYGYRAEDAARLATLFDEVVSEVRPDFKLSLIANMAAPPSAPLMAAPSPRESLEEGFKAAGLAADPAQRSSLLRAIQDSLALQPPADWVAAMRRDVAGALAWEQRVDRRYVALARGTLAIADAYARNAQVRPLARLATTVLKQDDRLGHQRPQQIASLLAAIDARLDAARKLRLARDQWAMRVALIAQYRQHIAGALSAVQLSRVALENIRDLAGPAPLALARLGPRLSGAEDQVASITPPVELETAHALLTSALRLARQAATARADAVRSGQMQGAWDAASAASGALMLFDRAMTEYRQQSRPPQPK